MNTLSSEKQNKKIVFALEHNEKKKKERVSLFMNSALFMLFSLL